MDVPSAQNQKPNSGLFGVMPNAPTTSPLPQNANLQATPSSMPPNSSVAPPSPVVNSSVGATPVGQTTTNQTPSQLPPQPVQQPSEVSQPTVEPSTPSATITSSSPKKSSKFGIFIGIFIFLALGIWGGVAYLYTQNQKLKEGLNPSSTNTVSEPLATPTPEFTPDQIQILNGSIVRKRPSGEVETLVNKESYATTGITGFARVAVSPDNKKMCFESWAPAPKPALYFTNIDGSEVTEVGSKKKNCVWLTDSQKMVYIDDTSAKLSSDIYSYDTINKLETNLTESSVATGVTRRFEVVSLSADGSKIICTYSDVGASESSGNCEIDLTTSVVETMESATESTPS